MVKSCGRVAGPLVEARACDYATLAEKVNCQQQATYYSVSRL